MFGMSLSFQWITIVAISLSPFEASLPNTNC
jgi:hypothetical protein